MAALFVALQYVLPQHWMTAAIWRVARIRQRRVKDFLIRRFVALYDVDIEEVRHRVPDGFETFNDFFTRELADGERCVDDRIGSIVSPVDGTVSIAGTLEADSLIQAKGIHYSVGDLLGTDLDQARAFENGRFVTIYLAPYNYHRVHAPLAGDLVAARYLPGDLFSVNAGTVARVNGLFRRNERLVMHFRTAVGPAALIFVGALHVGSISTPWSGEIRPRKTGVVDVLPLSAHPTDVEKGGLLGWFNMGSTVILLLPQGAAEWETDLIPGQVLRMGERIGHSQSAG